MKKAIVITSIFNPTEAVKKFSELPDYNLIVAGDKKSPEDWSNPNTTFLSADNQLQMNSKLAEILPFNHYCRKMTGYIHAIREGAEIIIDTDDDNIPKDNWSFPDFDFSGENLSSSNGFVNIYNYFTNKKVWPRGYPLELLTTQEDIKSKEANTLIGIWQGLADEDPDVDAIYRLTDNTPIYFDSRKPIALEKGTICPYNSQNTAYRKELFPLLYLPCTVTFRFTDILRGLVAQPIMWLYGYNLGFTEATVVQQRNPHNYLKDFESEIPCYLYAQRVVDIVRENTNSTDDIYTNLLNAYKALAKSNIVKEEEIELVEKWINDIKSN